MERKQEYRTRGRRPRYLGDYMGFSVGYPAARAMQEFLDRHGVSGVLRADGGGVYVGPIPGTEEEDEAERREVQADNDRDEG